MHRRRRLTDNGKFIKERKFCGNGTAVGYKLSDYNKSEIFAIPNFDAAIFKEITGIDVKNVRTYLIVVLRQGQQI